MQTKASYAFKRRVIKLQKINYWQSINPRANKIEDGSSSTIVEGLKVIKKKRWSQLKVRKKIFAKCWLVKKSWSRTEGVKNSLLKKYSNGGKAK